MSTLVTVLHVIVCLFLMLTVLLQSGKGGGMGAAFGGGNAATVFGGSGASGFLKRLTAIAGTIFMITSMVLAFLSSRNSADALDSYGKEQNEIAKEKADAKTRALKAAKAGAGSGSAGVGSAGMNPLTPLGAGSADIEAPIVTPETPATGSGSAEAPATGSGSAAAGSGSAATPAAGSGSAAKPAAGSGSAAKPATPAAGSGSAAKPAAPAAGSAAKPVAPTTPAPTAPAPAAPAPAGSGSSN